MSNRNGLSLAFLILTTAIPSLPAQQGSTVLSSTANPPQQHSGAPNPSASTVEHWDKLALHDNDLHSDPAVIGQVDTFPDFTRELLRVQWRDDDPIDLYIVRPAGVAHPPVILYLYGYPGEAVRFLNYDLCRTVTRGGYAAVSFSPMLTGQRYHDVPMTQWFVSDLQRSLVGTAHDVQMVLNYLAEQGDFDMSRVGVFGEGSGGTVAMLAASVDPRIKALDVLNPWGDWPSWFSASRVVPDRERAQYLKPEFQKSIAPLDPVAILPRLGAVPLRLQQNLWDSARTPSGAAERIAAALPADAKLAQYKDELEYYNKVGNNGKMLDWIYDALSSPPLRSRM
jgi:hypothetical protein